MQVCVNPYSSRLCQSPIDHLQYFEIWKCLDVEQLSWLSVVHLGKIFCRILTGKGGNAAKCIRYAHTNPNNFLINDSNSNAYLKYRIRTKNEKSKQKKCKFQARRRLGTLRYSVAIIYAQLTVAKSICSLQVKRAHSGIVSFVGNAEQSF